MRPDYSKNDPVGWCGDPRRGAALGRPTISGDKEFSGKLYIRRIRLCGDYDRNGTYFGCGGDPLYWIASEDCSIDFVIRAKHHDAAKEEVAKMYRNAKFFR